MRRLALFLLCCLVLSTSLFSQDLASFEKRVTVKTLPNGLTVILLQRKEAPVFSFQIQVDAGSAQDPKGASGLAHMFEHMAFKGSDTIGTKDYAKEKPVLDALEAAYIAYDTEKQKIVGHDEKKVKELAAKVEELRRKAQEFVVVNEFADIVESHGGAGLNASTFEDQTEYFYSMPANQLELWANIESNVFLHPVYREFYKERDVVLEERRMRVDSSPIGRLIEQLLASAYTAHPYQISGVGWYSEISQVTATDAQAFHKTYYTPTNLVLSVVGDIEPGPTMALIEKYFGRLPKGPKPPELRTVEPKQAAEREVILKEAGQPWYIEGYHRPGYNDPDDAVYDVIGDLLSEGRTSRMYRSLVRDKKIALFAGGQSGFPGDKYPNLFIFFAVPNRDKTNAELASAFREEIDKLKNTDVSDDELKMIKTRIRAGLIRGLADNQGLAIQLAMAQTRYGDWREIFRQIDRIDKVSKEDIRRVAQKTFVESNRTIGEIDTTKPEAKAAPKGDK
jgi:predicted Zn-dependent peptidase